VPELRRALAPPVNAGYLLKRRDDVDVLHPIAATRASRPAGARTRAQVQKCMHTPPSPSLSWTPPAAHHRRRWCR
jgi:hypothetical protein